MMGYWILFGGWRWLFWTITILSAINLTLFILLTKETFAPSVFFGYFSYKVDMPLEQSKRSSCIESDIQSRHPPHLPRRSPLNGSSIISGGCARWSPVTKLEKLSVEPSRDLLGCSLPIPSHSSSRLTMPTSTVSLSYLDGLHLLT